MATMYFSLAEEQAAEQQLLELEALLEKPTKVRPSTPPKKYAQDAFDAVLQTPKLMNGGHSSKRETGNPLRRTAYLDGLRGFAAFLVYILHHEIWAHHGDTERLEHTYGTNGKYVFVALPVVRNLFTGGHIGVVCFFVISGYVLANKPLSLIHGRDTMGLAENVGSALFRRWLRLYIPVAAFTFLWMTSWHVFGIMTHAPYNPPPERTWWDELWRWYYDFKNYSFFFHESYFNAYNGHAWSIPLEMRGSIVIYTATLAFSRCKSHYTRLRFELALIFYFLYVVDGWYCALFMVGMFLCDLDLLALKSQLPGVFARFRPEKTWINCLLLLLGLYLGGVQSADRDIQAIKDSGTSWYYLSYLVPQAVFDPRWFFRFWAAFLLLFSIPRIPLVKSFFESAFCQYLGRVSFSFYLIHGPVMWSVGDRIYAAVGRTREAQQALIPSWMNILNFPDRGPYGLEVNFLVPHLIILPLTLWLAEVGTRVIDEPSVRFSQWLFTSNTAERDILD